MIDEADRDGDGEVSLEEFERIMKVRLISLKHLATVFFCWLSRTTFWDPPFSDI